MSEHSDLQVHLIRDIPRQSLAAVKYFRLASNRKSGENGHFVYSIKCWPSGKMCAQWLGLLVFGCV